MCLAVPGEIVEISHQAAGLRMAKVSFAGVMKEICIEWLPEAGIGDFVLAHAGSALSMVDASTARETLDIFDRWASQLRENDDKSQHV